MKSTTGQRPTLETTAIYRRWCGSIKKCIDPGGCLQSSLAAAQLIEQAYNARARGEGCIVWQVVSDRNKVEGP